MDSNPSQTPGRACPEVSFALQNDALDSETAEGTRRRLEVLAELVRGEVAAKGPHLDVIEVGCGTGANILYPLSRIFVKARFLGTEIHEGSIEYASQHYVRPNLTFKCQDVRRIQSRFDVVICSEVMEHVAEYEDFFRWLSNVTKKGGLLIVTVPNGYGPKELECKLVRFLNRWNIVSRLQSAKNRLVGRPVATEPRGSWGTLNEASPHVNFFVKSDILKLFRSNGYEHMEMTSRRVWGGGPFSSFFINRCQLLCTLNTKLASRVPWFLTSSWVFWGRKAE